MYFTGCNFVFPLPTLLDGLTPLFFFSSTFSYLFKVFFLGQIFYSLPLVIFDNLFG